MRHLIILALLAGLSLPAACKEKEENVMSNVIEAATAVMDAIDSADEATRVAALRDAMRASDTVLFAEATLADGSTVPLTGVSDAGQIQTVLLRFEQGGESQTVGPFSPQDADNIFNLFLE